MNKHTDRQEDVEEKVSYVQHECVRRRQIYSERIDG